MNKIQQQAAALMREGDDTLADELVRESMSASTEIELDGGIDDTGDWSDSSPPPIDTEHDPGPTIPEMDDTPGTQTYLDSYEEDDEPVQSRSRGGSDVHLTADEPDTGDAIGDDLVALAAQYGLSEAQARRYRSEDDLRQTLLEIDTQAYQSQQEQMRQWQAHEQQLRQAQAAPPQQAQPDAGQAAQPEAPDFNWESLEDYDVALSETLRRYDQQQRTKIQQLEQQIAQQQAVAQQFQQVLWQQQQERARQEQERFFQDLDKGISSLGREFEDLLGTGETSRLVQGSPQWNNRLFLAQTAAQIAMQHQRMGRSVPISEIVKTSAAHIAFPDHYAKQAKQQVRQQIRKRQRSMQSRPSQSSSRGGAKVEQRRERALRRADAFFQKVNVDEPFAGL